MAAPVHPAPPPLGLPPGSVRAALALILCGRVWYLVVKERPVPTILAESALFVVAFYFVVRSTTRPPAAAPSQIVAQPLHLPRGAVRSILVLGFFGVIAVTWYLGRPVPQVLNFILQVLVSYLIGVAISAVVHRIRREGGAPSRAFVVFRNVNAVASLAVTSVICASILSGLPVSLPISTENFLAGTIAYYFGSRSSP